MAVVAVVVVAVVAVVAVAPKSFSHPPQTNGEIGGVVGSPCEILDGRRVVKYKGIAASDSHGLTV